MKRLLAVVLVLLFPGPAGAGQPLRVVTSEQVSVGAAHGRFTLSGDIEDAGTFTFALFATVGQSSFAASTEHVILVYSGDAGRLTLQNQCQSDFDGLGSLLDTCRAVVTDGTGAYAGLHGGGRCSGVLNFVTGLATRICQLRLND